MSTEETVEWKGTAEAPRWAGFTTMLEEYAWTTGLTLETKVIKRWFRETILFKVTGPKSQVELMRKAVAKSVREYQDAVQ